MSQNNAIATGALVLSVNADQMTTGLAQASKQISGWSAKFGKMSGADMAGGIVAAMKGGLQGIGGGLGVLAGTAIGGPVGAVIGGALGDALGSLPGKVVGIGASMVSELHDVAKQGNIATALGLSAEQFTGMAGLAKSVGSDTKDFIEGFATLSGKAMDAAAGKGEESVQIFQDLKINAAEFSKLGMEDQFYGLMTALQGVNDPAKRFNLLMKATGEDTGKNLLGLLKYTPEQLRKMADGFAVSSDKMKEAQKASEAFRMANAKLEKAWQNLAIAAAPMLTNFAELGVKIIDALPPAENLEGTFRTIGIVFDSVGESIGAVVKKFGELKDASEKIPSWVFGLGGLPGLAFGLLRNVEIPKIGPDKLPGIKPQAPGNWLKPIWDMIPPPVVTQPYQAPSMFAEAILANTRQAYSLEMRHKFGLGDKGKDVGKEQVDQLKKVNKNIEKQTAMIEKAPATRLKVIV